MTSSHITIFWAAWMILYGAVWILQDRWFVRELRKLAENELPPKSGRHEPGSGLPV